MLVYVIKATQWTISKFLPGRDMSGSYVMPDRVMSCLEELVCHIWQSYVMSGRVVSCLKELWHVWHSHVMSDRVMSCLTELCHVWQSYVMSERVMSCLAELCHVWLNYVMSGRVMSCQAVISCLIYLIMSYEKYKLQTHSYFHKLTYIKTKTVLESLTVFLQNV